LSHESSAIEKWLELQELARTQKIGDDALADRIDKELLPFWREASARFKPLRFAAGTKLHDSHQYLLTLTEARFRALELCVEGLRKHDVEIVGDGMKEMARGDAIIAARAKALEEQR
jgi:poly-gamma-glutamate capsule biosynthesis protein CapA/YwtB (metallophosphatase superfamily)